ncbi:hypothetical protein COO60DRAFT_1519120 [Scenedesmus sp. NREL 46B-D3]|nr:hypothetical protein COO60DRAFT_1519120 [Scenedesmus sp. NREL 46B-D3]
MLATGPVMAHAGKVQGVQVLLLFTVWMLNDGFIWTCCLRWQPGAQECGTASIKTQHALKAMHNARCCSHQRNAVAQHSHATLGRLTKRISHITAVSHSVRDGSRTSWRLTFWCHGISNCATHLHVWR